MFLASIRLAFLLAAVIASLHAAAETRFWTFTDVKFTDGAVASGYLGFDAGKITDWNIRVSQGQSSWPIAAFTYVPGNTTIVVVFGDKKFYFISEFKSLSDELAMDVKRNVWIQTLAPFDPNYLTVQLDSNEGGDAFYSGDVARETYRFFTGGSLVLTASEPPVTVVRVDEFYNAALGHYFITADPAEKRDLDTGRHPGWVRTGEFFKANATGSLARGSMNPVCRYYGTPLAGLDSHFYSADAEECVKAFWKYGGAAAWLYESDNVFQINLPDTETGACPVGTIPVYRLWNQRVDSNHRYTTKISIKEQMLAEGYRAEGYGPDGVVMCAVQ